MIHYLTYYHRGHNKRNSNELKHLHEYFSWKAEVVFFYLCKIVNTPDDQANNKSCVKVIHKQLMNVLKMIEWSNNTKAMQKHNFNIFLWKRKNAYNFIL